MHPSVRSLLAEAQPGEKAEDIMRRKCRAIVARGKRDGWSGPPFEPKILASILGIKVEETREDIPGDGQIFSKRGDVIIQYRAGQLPERQRFTICHEIAHTCFPDSFTHPQYFEGPPAADKGFQQFENLCNVGASELLFPLEDFRPDLDRSELRLRHTLDLATRYGASLDATMRRALDLTLHKCAAVFLTDTAFEDFKALPGRMRIKYHWRSGSFRGFLPKGTLVPKTSKTSASSFPEVARLRDARETWWIQDRPRSFYVEPAKLPVVPNLDYPKVVALLHACLPRGVQSR